MSAVILAMPTKVQRTAKRRLDKVELEARHSWMREHSSKWETEATDGVKYETSIRVVQLKELIRKMDPKNFPPLTIARMRRHIAEDRKRIEKRNRVKAWMASMGVELSNIKDAEQALFAAFDKLQERSRP